MGAASFTLNILSFISNAGLNPFKPKPRLHSLSVLLLGEGVGRGVTQVNVRDFCVLSQKDGCRGSFLKQGEERMVSKFIYVRFL